MEQFLKQTFWEYITDKTKEINPEFVKYVTNQLSEKLSKKNEALNNRSCVIGNKTHCHENCAHRDMGRVISPHGFWYANGALEEPKCKLWQ